MARFVDVDQNESIENPQAAESSVGTFLKGLAANAVQFPLQYIESVSNAPGTGSSTTGIEGLYPQAWKGAAEKVAAASPQPETFPGKIAYSVARGLPFAAANPAGLGAGLAQEVAGSVGTEAAKDLGFGTIGQIGASVLAQHGLGKAASFLKGAPKDPTKLQQYIGNLYEKEKQIGSQIPVKPSPLLDKIESTIEKTTKKLVDKSKFTQSEKNILLENMNAVRDQIIEKGGTLNASDIFDINKQINAIWSPKNTTYGKSIRSFGGLIKEELDGLYKKNPQWGNIAHPANELYSIQNWKSNFSNMMRQLEEFAPHKFNKILTNPITSGTIALLTGRSPETALGIGAAVAGAKGANKLYESGVKSYKFYNELNRTKEGQKLIWDIVTASAQENIPKLVSSLNKLDSQTLEFNEGPTSRFTDLN